MIESKVGGSSLLAPNLVLDWLEHGFGLRTTEQPHDVTTAVQTHSAIVLDAGGRSGCRIEEGDAIRSDVPGIAIGVRTADCVPILLADPVTRFVACVHAGWRGTRSNIVGEVIRSLAAGGVRSADLRAAIGPAIGPCCYEVGPEVTAQFSNYGVPPGRARIDLRAINRSQLQAAGVSNVWTSAECTFCDPGRFHSFRRDRERSGRMMSWIRIRR